MRYPSGHELPPEQAQANRKAIRLEWFTIGYMLSVIVLLYFTLGQSQAMKAAWIEDILTLFPPMAFLVASRFRYRPPTERFSFGYHRAISIAYLISAFCLAFLGLFILYDSIERLIAGVHPPIGLVEVFNQQIWLGYLMIAALLYGAIPPIILGRMKQPLAETLHDKVLNADAAMNRADWLTAFAAIAGIIGIGLGIWWADAAAAIVISLDITRDGFKHVRASVGDLMDDQPATYDEAERHPVIGLLEQELAAVEWIEESALRLREQGHLISGDVWVVPAGDGAGLPERLEALGERLTSLDWRVHDLALAPVASLEDVPEGLRVS
ncbi:MAG: cation diffusion facilitator family transporter [Actinomycetota bacterium]|nr:cation diffusion facilitator family transporter [Actinomycetota bacterium]